MKFENILKKASAAVAGTVVFLLAAGMYLSLKGFVFTNNGQIVLVKDAQANPLLGGSPAELTTPIADNIALTLPEDKVLGKKNAPLALYEFSSFGCTHCADFHLDTLPELQKEFIDSGKLKVIFAPFPLDRKSMQAAMIASCIPAENYYDYIKTVFKNQREWALSARSDQVLADFAAHNGISKETALKCLKNDKIAEEILDIRHQGIDKLNIQGTPSFLLIANGKKEMIYGAPSYPVLKNLLLQKLAH